MKRIKESGSIEIFNKTGFLTFFKLINQFRFFTFFVFKHP